MLLTCALLAALAMASGASASTTNELRGEWSIELKCQCQFPLIGGETLKGTALISTMDLETGVFSGTTDIMAEAGEFVENLMTKEKPHVTENKVEYIIRSQSPGGEFYFVVPEGTVAGGGNEMSGPGIYNPGSPFEEQGSFVAKKTRSWALIEKEEEEKRLRAEKEKFEKEGREKGEKEGREKGEQEGRAKGELEGLGKGELEGKEKAEQEVKLKAAQEATERAAKEAQAKTEREAKEKAEKEAAEKAVTQGREKAEKEAREKIEKEAKQKAEKEAKEHPRVATGQPAVLVGKSFTVTTAGQLSLELTNANGYAVTGALTLGPATAAKSAAASGGAPSKGKGTTGKAKQVVFAEAPYTIASHASKTVQLKLSKSALAELEHHKTLQLVATLTTRATGKPSSTKTYDITLKLAPAKHA